MPKKPSTVPGRRHLSTVSKRTSDVVLAVMPRTPRLVGIAADHGGYELKEHLLRMLREAGHDVIDFGDQQPKLDDDYPDFVVPLARAVADGRVERGVAICGSGVGASVAANKVAGVRACLIHENFSAHQGVEDDDLNLISWAASSSARPLRRSSFRRSWRPASAVRSAIAGGWRKWRHSKASL